MRRATATAIAAAALIVVGSGLAFGSASRLDHLESRIASGDLDYVVVGLLMIGVALVLTGFVVALAALAQYWIEAQDREDARRAAERGARAGHPTVSRREAAALEATQPLKPGRPAR
ncbi:hypothetical protein [Frondihabitans cladoniiphilus]|uniref:Uncharacterized protein n=1 Tax=Frondihabitans cladoniiphilus TaxID=715785 RepID=A0ABP8W2E6_9MICO